jgi:hypothetical protein
MGMNKNTSTKVQEAQAQLELIQRAMAAGMRVRTSELNKAVRMVREAR